MDTQGNQELLCCRACLAADCKLFNICEYKLADTFAAVSGTPISTDGLPQYLCMYCHSLLQKCVSFRAMCVRTQQHLMPELLKGELNTDDIRNIDRHCDRLFNLTISVVRVIDCVENAPTEHIKIEPNETDELNIEEDKIKTKVDAIELYIDEDNGHDSKNYNIDNVIKKDEFEEHENINNYNEFGHDRDDNEYILEVGDVRNLRTRKKPVRATSSKKIKVEKKETVKRKKIGSEVDDKSKDKLDKEDMLDAKPVKVKRGRPRKDVKRKFRDPANDNMPVFDFAKFENAYGTQIVTLSKQEQLEEIAARKQSPNYLESQFRCEDCGRGFDMEAAYKNHLLRHDPGVGPYACEVCGVRFRLRCRQHRHQDLHRLKFVCRECGFVTRQSGHAKVHFEVHQGRRFICEHCGKTYSKRSSYLSHVRLTHPAMNVACDQCGETFVGQAGLKHHKGRMHSEKVKPEHFKCTTCPAEFVSLDALNRHTDTGEHSGSPCEQCGESCASEEALQAHVGEKHPKETHRCEECRATFPSAAVFSLHYRRKHLGERAVAYAGAGAGEREHLRRKRRSKPARPSPSRKKFICETCGHISPNAAVLRYHQNNHLTVKPYPCSHCHKTFATNGMRNWHERRHTGEKPFKCPLCPLAFGDKSNFQRHHKNVHLGIHENVPCSICGRVFTTKSSLNMHVNYVHNGQPWPKRDRTRTKKELKSQ